MKKNFFAFLMTTVILTGCGTIDGFKELDQKGDTIYLKGDVSLIHSAAVEALSDKRLTAGETQKFPDGEIIYAEQSAVTGMIFNSYGGYAKITISSSPQFGANAYAVSAITRSKAVHEPAGVQDSLKGYNYNNPLIAREILQKIKKLLNEKYRS